MAAWVSQVKDTWPTGSQSLPDLGHNGGRGWNRAAGRHGGGRAYSLPRKSIIVFKAEKHRAMDRTRRAKVAHREFGPHPRATRLPTVGSSSYDGSGEPSRLRADDCADRGKGHWIRTVHQCLGGRLPGPGRAGGDHRLRLPVAGTTTLPGSRAGLLAGLPGSPHGMADSKVVRELQGHGPCGGHVPCACHVVPSIRSGRTSMNDPAPLHVTSGLALVAIAGLLVKTTVGRLYSRHVARP